MSRWDDEFPNHPAVQAAKQLQDAVGSLETENAAALEEIERLRKVADLVRATINRADPELISVSAMNETQGPLTNVLNEVQAFHSNGDVAHLTNANSNADQVLFAISRWEVPATPDDLDDLRERATSYRRSVGQLLHQIEDEAHGVKNELEEARSAFQSIREQNDSEIARVAVRLEEVSATIGQDESRLDAAISRVDEQFSNAEAQRAERFENMTNETRKDAAEFLQELKQTGDERLAEFAESATTIIEALRQQEQDARTLAASLGAVGVSGGYGAYAKQQKVSADFWRWVSVGSLALLLVGAFIALKTLPAEGLDWEHFVARIFVSVSLIALSGYAANQSAKHRRVEREVRKAEIELASLDPYLALFEPDRRNEIKAEIILRMVGHPLAPEGETEQVGAAQLVDLLQKALTALSKT